MSGDTARRGTQLATVTALVAVVMLVDGYDLQVMALLIAPMAEQWSAALADFGIVQSAAVLGLGIGAALIGPFGDGYGRRRFILAGFAALTAAVAGSAFAASVAELAGWRLLTGVALGATLVNASALLAEVAPARRRSFLLTLAAAGITVGALGSGLIAPGLVERYEWPAAFWFSAGVGVLIWIALFAWLPEAPSQNVAAGDHRSRKLDFFAVLHADYRASTFALWALFVGNSFLIYVLASWIPALIEQHGWARADAARMIVWFQAGGLAGSLVVATLMDRWHPFLALLVAYALAAACFAGFGVVAGTPAGWGLLFALLGAGISGVHLTMNAIAAVIYPPTILASGIGFTVAVARSGAIAAPLVGALLIRRETPVAEFMALQLVPLALCVASVLLLLKQRGRRTAGVG